MKNLITHILYSKTKSFYFLFIIVSLSLLLIEISLNNYLVQGYPNNGLKTIKVKMTQDQYNYKHLLGLVENTENKTVNHVIITARFLDSSNKSIGNFSKQTEITTLNPKEISPFDILIFDKNIYDKIKEYVVNINFNFTKNKDKNLVIESNKSHLDVNGFFFIDGKIRNLGQAYSNNTTVTSVTFNKNNELLGVWKAQTEPYSIPPLLEASFSIPITDKIQSFQISNYTLFAESDKFTKTN
jgi:hypothetical protein